MNNLDDIVVNELAFATLVPGTVQLVGCAVYLHDNKVSEWFKKLKKPKWYSALMSDAVLDHEVPAAVLTNLCHYLPLVYGTCRVFDFGGFRHKDTKVALYTFAAANIFGLFFVIPCMKRRCLPGWFLTSWTYTGLQIGTGVLYYSVDQLAGACVLPWIVTSVMATVLLHDVCELN